MKIAVLGTGAMGSLFAARLSALSDTTMVGTWKEQLAEIEEHGLRFIDPDGHESKHLISVADIATAKGPYHLSIILVKGWQIRGIIDYVKNIVAEDGLALTLQNGLGHYELLKDGLGESRSSIGVTSEGAMILKPGLVRYTGAGITHIGTTPATKERLGKVTDLFRRSGIETRLTQDLDGLVWGKLAVNAGINPLTALLQVRNGFLAEDKVAREIMCLAAEETATVASALGIELPYESASERVIDVAKATAANRSSMAQDIARGMPTEIETINGRIVELALEHDISVPTNLALYRLLKSVIEGQDWRNQIITLPADLQERFDYLSKLEAS
jgi:2-dehydropantoate 2-reductase